MGSTAKRIGWLMTWLTCAWLPTLALAEEFFTGFESEQSGPFQLGESPASATFKNGDADDTGVPPATRCEINPITGGCKIVPLFDRKPWVFFNGAFTWTIDKGKPGIIELETPAREVEFYFYSEIEATADIFDVNGVLLETLEQDGRYNNVGPTIFFTRVHLKRATSETLIGSIHVNNLTSKAWAYVDDFRYAVDDDLVGNYSIALTEIASGFEDPFLALPAPPDPDVLFIADRVGKIYATSVASGMSTQLLDISLLLSSNHGLMGFATHPAFTANGLIYTVTIEPTAAAADFSRPGVVGVEQLVLSEWQSTNSTDPLAAIDPASQRTLLVIDVPTNLSLGGALAFDNAGNLLLSVGDGGNASDAQDLDRVYGSVLRIDPAGNNSANGNYGVPVGNPFAGITGLDEILAYGFQNPGLPVLDPASGNVRVMDQGSERFIETNVLTNGGNFGWPFAVGDQYYAAGQPKGERLANTPWPGSPPGLSWPETLHRVSPSETGIASGGIYYQGGLFPADLDGKLLFVYPDGPDGGSVHYQDTNRQHDLLHQGHKSLHMKTCGIGKLATGEPVLLKASLPGKNDGAILRIDPVAGKPAKLSPRTEPRYTRKDAGRIRDSGDTDDGGGGTIDLFMLLFILLLARSRGLPVTTPVVE